MNNYVFFSIVFCVIYSMVVFKTMTKGVKDSFENDPASNAYRGRSIESYQSQKATDLKEKNERMMQDTRDKMDSLRDKMDRLKR